jgi:hypothetical protein
MKGLKRRNRREGGEMRMIYKQEGNKMKYREELDKKIKVIRKAIESGKKVILHTALGDYEITGITEDWAFVGKDMNFRRWAICADDIERLYQQVKCLK